MACHTQAKDPAAIRAANDPNIRYKGAFGGVAKFGDSLISGSEYLVKRSDYAYGKAYRHLIKPTGETLGGFASGIDDAAAGVTGTFSKWGDEIRKTFEPVSDTMGTFLGTLEGMLADPFGPQNQLGNCVTSLLNGIQPGLGDKVNGTITNLNLQAIANFPSQLFTSLDKLVTAIDNILAVPLQMIGQIYYGYMAIMRSISRAISSIIDGFIDMLFNFLDSLIPIRSILDLLSQISTLASQIGGIASIFGANIVTGFTNQILNFNSQITSILRNPLDLVYTVLPPEINEFINLVQNPVRLINQFLPPELSEITAKISSITGFGFNGNMGYSLQSILQGTSQGVIRSILTGFASQYNYIAPLLAGQSNRTQQSYPPTLVGNTGQYAPNTRTNEATRGCNEPQYEENLPPGTDADEPLPPVATTP